MHIVVTLMCPFVWGIVHEVVNLLISPYQYFGFFETTNECILV